MSSKLKEGITKLAFGEYYDESDEGFIQWDTDRRKEFGLPEGVDDRIDALYAFARELKEQYPPGQPLPTEIVATLTPGLEQEAQREQFIVRKLNDAVENGVTIGGVKHEGFGPYNPVVAASLARQRGFRLDLKDLEGQVATKTPRQAHSDLLDAVAPREEEIKQLESKLRNTRAGWTDELKLSSWQFTSKLVNLSGEEFDKYIEEQRLITTSSSYALVRQVNPDFITDKAKEATTNNVDDRKKFLDDAVKEEAYRIVEKERDIENELRETCRDRIAILESETSTLNADYEAKVPGLIAEAKEQISELKGKIKEETKIQKKAVPEDNRTYSGNLMASKAANLEFEHNVCRHQNGFALVLGEEAGLELVGIAGYITTLSGISAEYHYFVVSETTGNVIDITGSPQMSYGVSQREVTADDMMDGYTNVFKFTNGDLRAYGTGFQQDVASVLEAREDGSGKKAKFDEEKVVAYDRLLIRAVRDHPPIVVDNGPTQGAYLVYEPNPEPRDLPWASIEQQEALSTSLTDMQEKREDVSFWDLITRKPNAVEYGEAMDNFLEQSKEDIERYREYSDKLGIQAEERTASRPHKKDWQPTTVDWESATGKEKDDGPSLNIGMSSQQEGAEKAPTNPTELAQSQSINNDIHI